MKRSVVAILALIYITASSGVVMNIHYCMGKLSSVKMGLLAKNPCGCGSMEKKGCCKTEQKLAKVSDNHKAAYTSFQFNASPKILPVESFASAITFTNLNDRTVSKNHSPPDLSPQDIYLLNCVFRI